MRYWWVNQNQTHRQEISGGYIWSPKRNANGARNPFYETLREVAPGDVVFSFVDTRIAAIGIAQSYCWESPKPQEFGSTGEYWENIGWKVKVAFTPLLHRIRPKDHMEILKPLLPAKYSPLQSSGNGLQGIYLAEVSQPLAEVLAGLIGAEASIVTTGAALPGLALEAPGAHPEVGDDLDYWEHKLEQKVVSDTSIPETTREAIIRARVGQGKFKENVRQVEQRCRITGVDQVTHLVGSHIRPWRDSTNEERLNGENGLLLTPSIDHLFDRDFIGFEDSGRLIISPVAHRPSLQRMGVETDKVVSVGGFTAGQRGYLEYHRQAVLLMATK